jgi:hypothetical protein
LQRTIEWQQHVGGYAREGSLRARRPVLAPVVEILRRAVVEAPDAALASAIVWFDAFTSNVDRTARNTNLLGWHRALWLIDHGAARYFHHGSEDWEARAKDPFPRIADHVLLPFAGALEQADARLPALLTRERIATVVAGVPDAWLAPDDPAARRAAYVGYLCRRLEEPRAFAQEAIRARL